MALEFRLSGGENNTNPNGSLGGQMSDTAITTDVLQNLFDNISRNEALITRTEYRCIYLFNTGGGALTGVQARITINPSVTRISVGLETVGRGDGRTTGVAQAIAAEDTTPPNVKFFGEDILSVDDGPFQAVTLPIGLLKNGEGSAIWLKRVTEKGALQTVTLTLEGEHAGNTLPGDEVDDGGAIGELIGTLKAPSGSYQIGTMRVGFSDLG